MDAPDPEKRGPGQTDGSKMKLLGHDLRAAVSDIIGGLRLIDLSSMNEATRVQLERVRTSGEILARLLEQGLSMMLGEDDFAATHPANLPIARFVYDTEMRWSGRAREKGLGFVVTRAGDVPDVLTLDRVALDRLLSNILSNAIKYTDSGSVSLHFGMASSGALRISVSDEGPGFSADALTRLFEFQGRPEGADKPGEGLGMHITRDMAGRLGGTISVENLPGGGARVVLELPPDRWTIGTPDTAVELPDLRGIRVLLAEDNPTNQRIIGHMLVKLGAEFEIANDGIEALRWLQRVAFDLALIDIEMPRLGGIEVIRALREGEGPTAGLPVVAITAYVLRANRDAIYAAGADAILGKPLAGIESFAMTLANVLGEARALLGGIAEDGGGQPEFDRARFDHLLEIAGPGAASELLDRLVADLRKVERGLTTALDVLDLNAIRSESHVLVALAGAVGANRLQALSQTLNAAAHRRDSAGMAQPGQEALTRLDRLIHFVAQEQARRGEDA